MGFVSKFDFLVTIVLYDAVAYDVVASLISFSHEVHMKRTEPVFTTHRNHMGYKFMNFKKRNTTISIDHRNYILSFPFEAALSLSI